MLSDLEQPLHPKQKKQVIEAIRSLGLKVVPADVAAQAELPVLVAVQELNRVAADTNAHLEVSAKGEVTYVFDPRFEQSYALSGVKNVWHRIGRVVLNAFLTAAKLFFIAAFFILRISFGVLLIASVIIIIVVALVLILRLFVGDGDSGGGGGGGGDVGGGGDFDISGLGNVFDSGTSYSSPPFWRYFAFDWLWDWWYYGDYLWGDPYRYSYGYRSRYSTLPDYLDDFHYASDTTQHPQIAGEQRQKKKTKSKFLDSCFIVLFGEGDPNAHLEDKRWHEVAAAIRANMGVVTCEQVAPYLEVKPGTEDWMLPVLTRFNGMPDVTDSGHIIYTFPAFQQKAAVLQSPSSSMVAAGESPQNALSPASHPNATSNVNPDELRALYTGHLHRQQAVQTATRAKVGVEPYLQEETWRLGIDGDDVFQIFGFALFATIGSVILLNYHSLPFYAILSKVLLAIFAYGMLFFIVPALRWVFHQSINERIQARNEKRLEASAQLNSPQPELRQKLEEARSEALHALTQRNDSVVYTTEKDELEQRFEP